MSGNFGLVCWILAGLYISVGCLSIMQSAILHLREESSLLRCGMLKTVQQKVHFGAFWMCAMRAAFFIVGITAWNGEENAVVSNDRAFYGLDELSTILFFSLTSILALFWAELYYIAIDAIHIFRNFVRPPVYITNLGAVAITIGICLASLHYPVDVSETHSNLNIAFGVLYLFLAAVFGYFVYKADRELDQVPVQLSARRDRLRTLKRLAAVCISALVIRSLVIFSLKGGNLRTGTSTELGLYFFYYVLLELVPIIATVSFYRVVIYDRTVASSFPEYDYHHEGGVRDWETTPLTSSREPLDETTVTFGDEWRSNRSSSSNSNTGRASADNNGRYQSGMRPEQATAGDDVVINALLSNNGGNMAI